MTISNFSNIFPNEQSCRIHFKTQREQHGITCKKCQHRRHYWLNEKNLWQCANCRFRTTLRSGTVMQGSHLPFKKWYQAMVLMTMQNHGISAKEMQRQLKHKRYDTIWSLMHRIRNAMGNRQDQFTINGIIQFNESYLMRATPDGRKLRRGKRTQSIEKTKNTIRTGKCKGENQLPFKTITRMVVNPYKKFQKKDGKSLHAFNEKLISRNPQTSKYIHLKDHISLEIIGPRSFVRRDSALIKPGPVIRKAKKSILGTYYRIKAKYLQLYLDEFCFRLSQKIPRKNLFDDLANTVAEAYWH